GSPTSPRSAMREVVGPELALGVGGNDLQWLARPGCDDPCQRDRQAYLRERMSLASIRSPRADHDEVSLGSDRQQLVVGAEQRHPLLGDVLQVVGGFAAVALGRLRLRRGGVAPTGRRLLFGTRCRISRLGNATASALTLGHVGLPWLSRV